jgi:hypothetical protein
MNTVLAFVNTNRCTIEQAARQDSAQKLAIVVVLIILSITAYLAYKSANAENNRSIILIVVSGLIISVVAYYAIGLFFAPWCQ